MYAHGLSERLPVNAFYEGLEHIYALAVELGGVTRGADLPVKLTRSQHRPQSRRHRMRTDKATQDRVAFFYCLLAESCWRI
jgi:hypothetical protein